MKPAALVILSLLQFSCAKPGPTPIGTQTNEYDYIVAQFNNDLAELGYRKIDFSGLVVRKGDLSQAHNGASGMCWSTEQRINGSASITIDENVSKSFAVAVMYHEIGHCYLGLGHTSHESMMSAEIISKPVFYEFQGSKEGRLRVLKASLEYAGFIK